MGQPGDVGATRSFVPCARQHERRPRSPRRNRHGTTHPHCLRRCSQTLAVDTEHVETQHTADGDVVARRLHVCQVRDGQVCAVTTYCNGGWNDELRARHAAEAPMIRP